MKKKLTLFKVSLYLIWQSKFALENGWKFYLNESVEKMKLLIVGEWMFLTYCFIYRCVQFIVLLKGEKKSVKIWRCNEQNRKKR